MSNELKLRVGDVVRLKPVTVYKVHEDGSFYIKESIYQHDEDSCFEPDMVEEIISREETPQETIARLEAELASALRKIEWSGGECPVDGDVRVVAWLDTNHITIDLAKNLRWKAVSDKGWANIIAYMVLPS